MVNKIDSNMAKLEELVLRLTQDWGNRLKYFAEPGQITQLLQYGAQADFLNRDNGDGTFAHQVKALGKIFLSSSRERLQAP